MDYYNVIDKEIGYLGRLFNIGVFLWNLEYNIDFLCLVIWLDINGSFIIDCLCLFLYYFIIF